jgi:hypothetical protein
MSSRPAFKLSRLRQIGWSRWDPIGLNDLEDRPDDEYDSYLLQAAGRLWNGATEDEVADYLVSIEAEHMGLGREPVVENRAREVVRALAGYVSELRT